VTVYPDPSYGTVTCPTKTAGGSFNGLPYAGNLKLMKATADGKGVEFDFCNPDVAFLSQIAFAPLDITSGAYLIAQTAAAGKTPGVVADSSTLLNQPVGTGPYTLKAWDKGNQMTFTANPTYWGAQPLVPDVTLLWSDQSAQRLVQLQAGTTDGIDNPGKADLPAIQADATLKFIPRDGLNTFYLGFNNTDKPWDNQKVRQAIAEGIDRQRIVDNFYPPGSSVPDYFTPCAILYGCQGDKTWTFNLTDAKALLAAGLAEDGMTLADWNAGKVAGVSAPKLQFRAAVRPYLPDPPTIAQEIASQLQTNLGITVTLDQQESATFIDNNTAGKLDGIFMLGWGADYPDTSDFVDYFFGTAAGKKFGNLYNAANGYTGAADLTAAVNAGDQGTTGAARTAGYTTVNNLVKKYVPLVIMAHGGSGTAWKADVEGAYSSGVTDERFAFMKPGTRTSLTFVQNAEPNSIYCADESDGETIRACDQILEPLYNVKVNSLEPEPALATACTSNADYTVWTCALRQGVKFSNGDAFGPSDVINSFAAQWDMLSPMHKGRTGDFSYWPALIGGGDFLNTPPS
jgi:ABC-type transport system substrate-binding protein